MECSQCNFRFTGSPPDENVIGNYYKSESYISHSDTSRGIINKLYHIARDIMLARKSKLVKKFTGLSDGTLLDIGCGTGYFPKYMNNIGWKTFATERDPDAKAFARDINGISILDDKDIFDYKPGSFDCITLWHVLEHIHNPGRLLDAIKGMLNDSGTIVIAVPNSSSFDARHYGKDWAAWDVPRHLWHFEPATFRDFMKRQQLNVIATRRLPFDSFYVSILSEKYRKGHLPILSGLTIGFISFINSLFKKDRTSSLIYILKKSS
jgi:SAM-dependent methyltransferase